MKYIPKRSLHFIHYRANKYESTWQRKKKKTTNHQYYYYSVQKVGKVKPIAVTLNTENIHDSCLEHLWFFFPPAPTHLKDLLITRLQDLSVWNAKTCKAGGPHWDGETMLNPLYNTQNPSYISMLLWGRFGFLCRRSLISIIQVLKPAILIWNGVPRSFYTRR